MRLIVALCLLLEPALNASAHAQSAKRFDPLGQVVKDFEQIVSMVPAPAPKLIVSDDNENDGAVTRETITLSKDTIEEADSSEELKGLLAFLVAKAEKQPPPSRNRKMAPLSSMLAAGAVIAAGERLDPRNEGDVPVGSRRNYDWNPNAGEKKTTEKPRVLALILMQRVHSCSGAALALMNRLAMKKTARHHAPIHFIAQEAVQDFGMLAAPPDTSCIEK